MAIGTGLLLAGASLAGGAMSSKAAKGASADSLAAANAATALQREQYEQTTKNYAPYLKGGNDAMAAYLYELGLGPKPTFGGTAPAVERYYETTTGSDGTPRSVGQTAATSLVNKMMGMKSSDRPANNRTERYRVNGQSFSTLAEAEAFAAKNKTGGTEYQGYSVSPMARYLMEEGVDSIEGSAAAGGGLYSGATLEALEGNRKQIVQADTADYFSKLFGVSNMGMAAAGNQAGAGAQYAGNVGNLQMGAAQASGQARMQGAQAINSTLGDMAGIYGYFGGSNPMAAYASPTMAGTRPQPNPFY